MTGQQKMRQLVCICRPCLASIRNQQARPPLSRLIVSWGIQPNARARPTSFAALHALRQSKSTAAYPDPAGLSMTVEDASVLPSSTRADDSDLDAAYEELENALAAAVAHDKPLKRHADDVDDWSLPDAVSEEQRSNEHLTAGDQDARSPDEKWDEIEPLILGYDVVHKSEFKMVGDRGWSYNPWEWLCRTYVKVSSSKHELDAYKTSEEYFAAIYGDRTLEDSRRRADKRAQNLFDTWFGPLPQQLKPISRKGLYLEHQPSLEEMEAMKTKWRSLSPRLRHLRWPGLITKCLKYAPRRLPAVLQVTMEHRTSRPYMVQKLMRLLADQITDYRVQDQAEFAEAVVMTMLCVLRNTPPRAISFSQDTVFRITRHASTRRVAELYRALKEYEWKFRPPTRMQLASRLAKDIAYRSDGLDIAREMIAKDQLDLNSVTGAALATSLLAIQNDGPVANGIRAAPPPSVVEEVNETLLANGLIPNIVNLTAIIQTLCESKQLIRAWKVYDFMVGQGIEADETVLLVLLHGSKLCFDYDSAKRVVEMAVERGVHNAHFWNEVLHLILNAARLDILIGKGTLRNRSMFAPMCFVYNKFFHQEPLQKLMITNISHHSLEASGPDTSLDVIWPLISKLPGDREILEPGTATLYIMLSGYIRGFARSANILAFWRHFERLLKTGDPVAGKIVSEAGPKLHNMILLALCQHEETLPTALEILTIMLNDTIEAEMLADRGVKDDVPRHPTPDRRSWGILLKGFMYHKRHEQGEAVLNMMYRHGISPDISIWNQLLGGYARGGQAIKVMDVMNRLHREGLVPDEYTWRAFSKLRLSREAADLVRKMRAQRRMVKDENSVVEEYTKLRDLLGGLSDDISENHTPAARRGARREYRPPGTPNLVRRVTR